MFQGGGTRAFWGILVFALPVVSVATATSTLFMQRYENQKTGAGPLGEGFCAITLLWVCGRNSTAFFLQRLLGQHFLPISTQKS